MRPLTGSLLSVPERFPIFRPPTTKKRASYFYGRNSTKLILRRPAAAADHGGRCCQGLMGSRRHGSAIDLRRWQMVEEGVLHDGPLFNG